MSNINSRIRELIDFKKMNINSFSIKIGLDNNVTIGNIIKTRLNKPSFDIIQKILQTFDDVSAEWLILGTGYMIKNNVTDNKQTNDCISCLEKERHIKLQNKYIEKIEEELERCKQEHEDHMPKKTKSA